MEKMETMHEQELMEINGGGFAYDVGRALRFMGITFKWGYNNGIGATMAAADWAVNAYVNEQSNGGG